MLEAAGMATKSEEQTFLAVVKDEKRTKELSQMLIENPALVHELFDVDVRTHATC